MILTIEIEQKSPTEFDVHMGSDGYEVSTSDTEEVPFPMIMRVFQAAALEAVKLSGDPMSFNDKEFRFAEPADLAQGIMMRVV